MTLGNVGQNFAPIDWVNNGWHWMRDRASQALTHFSHDDHSGDSTQTADENGVVVGNWGLLAMEVIEHADRFELRMEVPGLDTEDIQVEVLGAHVRVAGTKRSEHTRKEGELLFTERAFGRFERVVPLPANTVGEQASARYDKGVLHIDVPKGEEQSGRSVPVN